MNRPDLRAEVLETLHQEYPELRFEIEGDVAKVRGVFPVADETGVLDRFAIEMVFPPDYPDSLPIIRETGKRIPWCLDRHVNAIGETCVLVPEEWFVLTPDQSFRAFMGGPVRNYFLGQALVEIGQPWPFGERSHGTAGVLEAYSELLGFDDTRQMRTALSYLSHDNIKGHWRCPCGNGSILRRCHVAEVRALQGRIAPRIARMMIKRLSPGV